MLRTLLLGFLAAVTIIIAVAYFSSPKFSEPAIEELVGAGFLEGDSSANLDSFVDNADSMLDRVDIGTAGLAQQGDVFWTWNVLGIPAFDFNGGVVESGISVWAWKGDFYVSVQYGDTILLTKQKTKFQLRRSFHRGLRHLEGVDGVKRRSETQLTVKPETSDKPNEKEGEWIEVKRGVRFLPPRREGGDE